MKKILTFVVLSFLLGGFVANANAQEKKSSAKDKQEVKTQQKGKKTDWNTTIKDYEVAVDKCVTLYEEMQKTGGDKSVVKDFNTALSKAEKLKKTLEKAKDQLDRTQVDRLNKANQKLSKVYAKQ